MYYTIRPSWVIGQRFVFAFEESYADQVTRFGNSLGVVLVGSKLSL